MFDCVSLYKSNKVNIEQQQKIHCSKTAFKHKMFVVNSGIICENNQPYGFFSLDKLYNRFGSIFNKITMYNFRIHLHQNMVN